MVFLLCQEYQNTDLIHSTQEDLPDQLILLDLSVLMIALDILQSQDSITIIVFHLVFYLILLKLRPLQVNSAQAKPIVNQMSPSI